MVTIIIGNETVSVEARGGLYESPRSCFDGMSVKEAKEIAGYVQDGYPDLRETYNETASFLDSDSRNVFMRIYAAANSTCTGCTVHDFA